MKYRVIPALILVPGDVPESTALDFAGHMQFASRRVAESFGGRLLLDEARNDGFVECAHDEDIPYSVDDSRIVWPKGVKP